MLLATPTVNSVSQPVILQLSCFKKKKKKVFSHTLNSYTIDLGEDGRDDEVMLMGRSSDGRDDDVMLIGRSSDDRDEVMLMGRSSDDKDEVMLMGKSRDDEVMMMGGAVMVGMMR